MLVLNDKRLTELLTEFISQYVNSLSSGVCNENQCGIALFTEKDEYMFFAVERNDSIESNPKQLVPAQMSPVVAHAIFVRTPGTFRFSTKDTAAMAATEILVEDPISIRLVPANGEPQVWMLSLDSVAREDDDAWYQAYRAEPATIRSVKATPQAQQLSNSLH